MTARLAPLLAAALLLAGCTSRDAAENGPAAVEPELVRVSGPEGPVEPVLGYFPVGSGPAVVVVRMPAPAELEVRVDGRRLEDAEVEADTATEPAEWRVTAPVSGPSTLELVMVSVNPSPTGRARRSEPLAVRVRESAERFRLTGRAFLDIDHPQLRGKRGQDVEFELEVDPDAGTLHVVSFPEIVVGPMDTGLGQNTTTITRTGGGSGTFDAAGNVTLPIELHFDHSHLLAGDSDASFELTTREVGSFDRWGLVRGSPVDLETAEVQLVDVSTFRGGYLDGRRVRLDVHGRLR